MYHQTLDTMAFICSNNYHQFITIPIISYTFNSLHIYHVSIFITITRWPLTWKTGTIQGQYFLNEKVREIHEKHTIDCTNLNTACANYMIITRTIFL